MSCPKARDMERRRRPAAPTLALAVLSLHLAATSLRAQMATADRLEAEGFWPTKGVAARQDFVGAAACRGCHASRAVQETTSMANTLRKSADSEVLQRGERLELQSGTYTYRVERRGADHVFSVSDGVRSAAAALRWAFGVGTVGQTWVFERDSRLHESRVSYYPALRALGFTPKRALHAPRSVEEAIERPMSAAEARRCFGCHATAAATAAGFDLAALIPGVTCEACHGPGREHVAAMERRARQPARAGPGATTPAAGSPAASPASSMLNPRRLEPADSVDFCGACHATFWDVKLAGEGGIAALRSQPHRLQSSRCWGEGDARLTCVACHDPHKPLVRDAGAYDRRCLACHAAKGSAPTPARPGAACSVSARDCTSCHMPKYTVPEMHAQFTDHLIRVARPPASATPGAGQRR
jgi:hypothetical protein